MPRTRHERDRDEKVAEILDAAEGQLRAGGYGSLSIPALARELGIAHNSVYWYFPSKDHLFVAVLEQMATKVFYEKPKGRDWISHVLWVVDALAPLQPLGLALHERAQQSEVARDFERRLLAVLEDMLVHVLAGNTRGRAPRIAARACLAAVYGSHLVGLSVRDRRAVIRFILEAASSE